MTATFINLATATTSHYQPLDRGISSNLPIDHRQCLPCSSLAVRYEFLPSAKSLPDVVTITHRIVGDCDHIHSRQPSRLPHESKDIIIVQCRVAARCWCVVIVSSDALECIKYNYTTTKRWWNEVDNDASRGKMIQQSTEFNILIRVSWTWILVVNTCY